MARDKVLRWCLANALFAPGDTVTAALSGGADSVAMTHLLLSLRDELGIRVRAAHYNHHLRGAESDRDEAFCRALCRAWGIALICGGGDVAAEARRTGQSIESAARALRYAFLQSVCEGGKTATAHTADDNLETVLINLTRGTSLRGLCGIPPVRGGIVRPVLCLTRADVERYLANNSLRYMTDSTNLTDDALRNRIRHGIVPRLAAENPLLSEKTLCLTESLRADEVFLRDCAAQLLKQAEQPDGLAVAVLCGAPRPIRLRALRQALEAGGAGRLCAAHLDAADTLLCAPEPAASLSLPGLTIRREYGLLCLGARADAKPFSPFLLPMPGAHPLSGGNTLVCTGPLAFSGQRGLYLALSKPPLVRPRRPGDRLRLSGGTKSVKEWMIDRKIPAALRGAIPILELDGTIAAVWNVGADPAFRPASGQPCYHLELVTGQREGIFDDRQI